MDEEMVQVYEGRGSNEPPEMITATLEGSGIRSVIKSDLSAWSSVLGMAVPTYRVFVHPRDAEAAHELLTEVNPGEEARPDEYDGMRRGLATRQAPTDAPVVLGGFAVVLAALASVDLILGWGMWWALIPVTLLAIFVAWQART